MGSTNFKRVFLNKNEEKEILQGFPWVFDNEISHFKHRENEKQEWKNETFDKCTIKDGEIVEIYTKAGGFLGCGVLNKKSKISVRIISDEHADQISNDFESFWYNKILNSYKLRQLYFKAQDSYRLVFGESDLIPGLICERFCDIENKVFIVIQFLSLSCNIFRKEILRSIVKICKPDFIYERSDSSVREKEGLECISGWLDLSDDEFKLAGKSSDYYYKKDDFIILENDIKLKIDIINGQKTGYFLDQKYNRQTLKNFVKGKSVLDTFTHTGAFGLNAVKYGAKSVISVDISEEAVKMVGENIRLNNASDKMTVVCRDVFELLKEYEKKNQKFDIIILDPPAFTKSAKMIEKAYGGYKEINLRAMRLLNDGGILITCSCSYFMETNLFVDMLMHAAIDSHKKVQILEKRGAGPDHPVLLGYPKSEYLKCVICRIY
ncbi:MAG: class I SAM-dependent rRNA methyltransferase [Treponema sp.]|nr:class I SAM-dependent rRNA methyltransferase [Treponema sp.]